MGRRHQIQIGQAEWQADGVDICKLSSRDLLLYLNHEKGG